MLDDDFSLIMGKKMIDEVILVKASLSGGLELYASQVG